MRVKLGVLIAGIGLLMSGARIAAHHSTAADFEEDKSVTIKGTVSKIEWENPHARFFVDRVFLFHELIVVVTPVPNADLRVGVVRVGRFHFLNLGNFGGELRLDAGDEIVDVFLRAGAALGHFDLGLEIVPRFVTEPERDLVTQLDHLI